MVKTLKSKRLCHIKENNSAFSIIFLRPLTDKTSSIFRTPLADRNDTIADWNTIQWKFLFYTEYSALSNSFFYDTGTSNFLSQENNSALSIILLGPLTDKTSSSISRTPLEERNDTIEDWNTIRWKFMYSVLSNSFFYDMGTSNFLSQDNNSALSIIFSIPLAGKTSILFLLIFLEERKTIADKNTRGYETSKFVKEKAQEQFDTQEKYNSALNKLFQGNYSALSTIFSLKEKNNYITIPKLKKITKTGNFSVL